MSIMICYKCDKHIDTDYEEFEDIEDFEVICIHCKEKEEE